jgi:DNA replication protein DnaC
MASLAQAYSREEIGDINTESNIYCITQTRRDVEFWPILELVGRLRDEIRGGDYSVSRRCRECDLLIIDDFGEERVTDFVLEELERIIDSRYRDKRPIAVSTNLTTSQIIEKYGERAISRWSESCAVVALNGEDHRLGGAK